MNDLETRIEQGKKAIALDKERGMDTSLWDKELARLETTTQAQGVAGRTRGLLAIRGWCLWKCSILNGDIIVIVRNELVSGYPEGYPVYTEAELERLCRDDVSEATLRLVHEAKKLAGATVVGVEAKNHAHCHRSPDDSVQDYPAHPCHNCGCSDYGLCEASRWGKAEWLCSRCHPKPESNDNAE